MARNHESTWLDVLLTIIVGVPILLLATAAFGSYCYMLLQAATDLSFWPSIAISGPVGLLTFILWVLAVDGHLSARDNKAAEGEPVKKIRPARPLEPYENQQAPLDTTADLLATTPCRVCGRLNSVHSRYCPHCEQPKDIG